jgi:hypothetical protein
MSDTAKQVKALRARCADLVLAKLMLVRKEDREPLEAALVEFERQVCAHSTC